MARPRPEAAAHATRPNGAVAAGVVPTRGTRGNVIGLLPPLVIPDEPPAEKARPCLKEPIE
ncbi:hypothetical protein AB0K14_22090 [Actinosynnema sp. NPDC050801]|jgi:hypothetical protein|uniref:hypothetical protein n=1 Tax=unclassified Actinosynnema TaxID=2637065 RepID=UPI0033F5421C